MLRLVCLLHVCLVFFPVPSCKTHKINGQLTNLVKLKEGEKAIKYTFHLFGLFDYSNYSMTPPLFLHWVGSSAACGTVVCMQPKLHFLAVCFTKQTTARGVRGGRSCFDIDHYLGIRQIGFRWIGMKS